MSRFDDIGIFWEDLPSSRKASDRVYIRPPVPETGWTCPTSFPNLAAATVLSVDVETKDLELLDSGPGWGRKRGHIVGFSIGAKDARGNIGAWYYPLRHEDTPEDNHPDPEMCLRWLGVQLGDNRPKIGANLIYDLGWLEEEGIVVNGPLYDVQHAEALMGERNEVNLDALAEKYLGEGKITNLLYQWCADYWGGNPTGKQRANIYRCPPSLVGHYGEGDASLPIRVMEKQWPTLHERGLVDLFNLECRLIRPLIKMRQAGVKVDLSYANQLFDQMGAENVLLEKQLSDMVGFQINVNSSEDIARAFDKFEIQYPRTEKGAPSFRAAFLEDVTHPVGQNIVDIRQRNKLRGTFIQSYILENEVDGFVYGSFNQLRGDGKGARSGRFSSDTPNLQNIPIRTEIGKKLRRIFVPDDPTWKWRKYDYSQIEYRFLAHYAVGPGSDAIRQRYADDPETDYHNATAELIEALTGIKLPRSSTKNINFGLTYGMGKTKLINDLGLSWKKGVELFDNYHKGVPFTQTTMDATIDEAARNGFITTVLGRRSYFDLWEPADYSATDAMPLPYELARSKYGNIRRAMLHKALNRRLQGSAADLMKKAMVDCHEAGIFEETGYPRLTVHDELDFNDPGGKDEAFIEMHRTMEQAIPLLVPVLADFEIGPNWGDVD